MNGNQIDVATVRVATMANAKLLFPRGSVTCSIDALEVALKKNSTLNHRQAKRCGFAMLADRTSSFRLAKRRAAH